MLGASSPGIARMLVTDFTRWVALANVIAWPLAWYASSEWLNGFAYSIDVDPLMLLPGNDSGARDLGAYGARPVLARGGHEPGAGTAV